MPGLTFGLAGTVVHDDYDVDIRHTPGGGQPPIEQMGHGRIYLKIGAAAAPDNATRVDKVDDAVKTMLRQVIFHGLYPIAADLRFAPAPAPAVASQPAAPAATPTPSAPQAKS